MLDPDIKKLLDAYGNAIVEALVYFNKLQRIGTPSSKKLAHEAAVCLVGNLEKDKAFQLLSLLETKGCSAVKSNKQSRTDKGRPRRL